MVERNFILDRLRSKRVTIDEFNYDKLEAPPIAAYFSPFDIANLNQIARSLKYSARPKEKYDAIDKIMRSRGFQKIAAGTNRICYRCLEDTRFVAKVAYDAVGIGDNPREFRNQFLLKPFVTKIFEVTPCGTLAFAERVNPITSREEFLSMAEDIFTAINEWFIGEYVLEDIGVDYFMNWSCRTSFGPVLLDYPYVYKLDGNKLYCNAPDINTLSGCCDGEIDYDDGFNHLYCKKCGAQYKAVELAKDIEENKVIIKKQGDIRMKVSLKGGSSNVSRTVTTGEFADHAKSIPNSSGMKISLKGGSTDNVVSDVEVKKVETPVLSVNGDATINENEEVNEMTDVVVDENSANEPEEVIEATKSEEKDVRLVSPVIFAPEEKADNKTKFYDLVKELAEMVHNCEDYDLNRTIVRDTLSECFGSDIEPAEDADPLTTINNHLMDYADEVDEDVVEDVLSYWLEKKFIITTTAENIDIQYDKEHEALLFKVSPIVQTVEFEENDNDTEPSEDFIPRIIYREEVSADMYYPFKDIISQLANIGYKLVEVDSSTEEFEYGEPRYFAGVIKKISEVFVESTDEDNVILVVDENGNYLTTGEENNIIAIDCLDDKHVDGLAVVPKEWLQNSILAKKVEDTEPSAVEEKTGAFPPTTSEE